MGYFCDGRNSTGARRDMEMRMGFTSHVTRNTLVIAIGATLELLYARLLEKKNAASARNRVIAGGGGQGKAAPPVDATSHPCTYDEPREILEEPGHKLRRLLDARIQGEPNRNHYRGRHIDETPVACTRWVIDTFYSPRTHLHGTHVDLQLELDLASTCYKRSPSIASTRGGNVSTVDICMYKYRRTRMIEHHTPPRANMPLYDINSWFSRSMGRECSVTDDIFPKPPFFVVCARLGLDKLASEIRPRMCIIYWY